MKKEMYTFPGLLSKSIRHPEENQSVYQVMQNKQIQTLLKKANDLSVQIYRARVLGGYVELTEETAPEYLAILKDVCRILNYPEVPKVYVCHMYSQVLEACGSDIKYITVSDYTLEHFNEEELYYMTGNAIAMYKAGHTDLANLMNFMSGQIPAPLRIPLLCYLRAADLTSDRGGLLACQSFAAAVRCHLHELGMPLTESRRIITTDEEAVAYVEKYLKAVKTAEDEYGYLLVRVIKGVQNLTYFEGPANKMLSELYSWYIDPKGYRRIIRTQGRPFDAVI